MCDRHWRYPASGGFPLAIDWTQLAVIAAGLGTPLDPVTTERLLAMEAEAASVFAEREAARQKDLEQGRGTRGRSSRR
jgi:hypothetical protein